MPDFHFSEYDQEFVTNIDNTTKQTAERYLSNNTQFSQHSLPWQFSAEFKQHLDEAINYVRSHYGTLRVTQENIYRAVHYKFEAFCKTLNSLIIKNNLSSTINDKIHFYLNNQGLSEFNIPTHYMANYREHTDMIKGRALSIMSTDKKEYIRNHELDKIIDDELRSFVRKVKDYNSSSYSTPSYSTSSTYEESQKIYMSDLEKKVTGLIHKHLVASNLSPDTLPAEIISNYHDRTSNIFTTLRNKMSVHGRSFVTVAEAELLIKQELESIIASAKKMNRSRL